MENEELYEELDEILLNVERSQHERGLRSTQRMKNQMFVYLASCFYLISLELQCFSEERYNV
ncbi:MAG: hypothetical protein AB1765_06125 [Candidatus Hydrogenedentota bacterium]